MGTDLGAVRVLVASATAIELEPANSGEVAYMCVGQ